MMLLYADLITGKLRSFDTISVKKSGNIELLFSRPTTLSVA